MSRGLMDTKLEVDELVRNRKAKENARNPMVICICGMAGSGKSTVAKRLAEKCKLQYFSGGDALKALAMEEGYVNVDRGWWEREEGMRFLKRRARDRSFDSEIDRKLLERAQLGSVILDSWTMPWLLKIGFKIWLEASPEKRAERIAERDGMSVEEALDALRTKERQTKDIYRKLYGFRLGEDYEPFHLILDTENLDAEAVFQVLCAVIDSYVHHS
jgi:cytidylate kinase